MPRHWLATAAAALSLAGFAPTASAINLDFSSPDSIKSAAYTAAYGMVKYYKGNESGQVPGILPQGYYWWEAGAMFNSLINYWYYTGDSQWNDITSQALLFQASPDLDYMPANQTSSEGNDDQMFWGYTVMTAAEYKFPNPPADKPQWLALAQGVFNSQAARWDSAHCNGGLRWQFNPTSPGYNYKNTPSNGGLFNLASRLYAYTGNETYGEWSNKIYDWMSAVDLVSPEFAVYDGTDLLINCSRVDQTRWTYTQAIMLNGAAVMYQYSNQSDTWRTRTEGLWKGAQYFFNSGKIMFEPCELAGSTPCDTDQQSFKAYLSRFMAASTKYAPFLLDEIQPYLTASAQAAAQQCDGGTDGVTCGMKWTQGSNWDGSYGVGQQMAALEIIQANLIKEKSAPVTGSTGGISVGDPTAGTHPNGNGNGPALKPITTADKAGAGIVTAVVIIFTLGGAWWLLSAD